MRRAFAPLLLLAGLAAAAPAQQPAAVTRAEFARLRWLEGSWRATREGQRPTFERYSHMNDSTFLIQFMSDSTLTSTRGSAMLELRRGRLYQVSGQSRWIATVVRPDRISFVPEEIARTRITYRQESTKRWIRTTTVADAAGPREEVSHLERIP
jgi:hypothetical protein